MNARDELVTTLSKVPHVRALHLELPASIVAHAMDGIADAVLAAGYTKRRTITTAEELDGLADDSVVLDDMDGPLTKVGAWWHAPSDEMRSNYVILPTTVLYEPAP